MKFYIKIADHEKLTYYKKTKIKGLPEGVRLGVPALADKDKNERQFGDDNFVAVYYVYTDPRLKSEDLDKIAKDVTYRS